MKYSQLDTPALLIDREILLGNLTRMQLYADAHRVALRPHTKTNKIPAVALWQTKLGAKGIAVAKVGEAEVMADHGLDDIFIANQVVGESKLRRIARLAEKVAVSFGIDSVYQILEAESVFSEVGRSAHVLIEVEIGEQRCGVDSDHECRLLLDTIKKCPHVRLMGFFGHDGNTYQAADLEELKNISLDAQKKLVYFADLARASGMEVAVVSYGSTPPLVRQLDIVDGITEIRPGTYALMDVSQGYAAGTFEQCAATVLTTVISRPVADRVIFDVGAKGLTMQQRTVGICHSHGKGMLKDDPDVQIDRIFDEHAIVNHMRFAQKARIGQKYRIIPVHICPVCNLYDTATLISGDEVVEELVIAARGKMQ